MGKAKNNSTRLKRRLGYILIPLIYGLIISGIIFASYVIANKVVDKYIDGYSAVQQTQQQEETEGVSGYYSVEDTTWQ